MAGFCCSSLQSADVHRPRLGRARRLRGLVFRPQDDPAEHEVGERRHLTARGASTTAVMLAGNWKTARMVAHYSAGATAERGAVRKYL